MNTTSGRLIGLQHRVKRTVEGEARPTMLHIRDVSEGGGVNLPLETDLAELDWVHGKLPTQWENVPSGTDLVGTEEHHIEWRDPVDGESLESVLQVWPRTSLRIKTKGRGAKRTEVLEGVPVKRATAFTGLAKDDVVLGILGGSGGDLISALILKGEVVGAKVLLVSPAKLKKFRAERREDKADDAVLIVELFRVHPELFHQMYPADVDTWDVVHGWTLTERAMKDRLKIAQRALQRARRLVFLRPEYLGAKFESALQEATLGDVSLSSAMEAEAEAEKVLDEAVERHPLYQKVFAGVKGVGPRTFGKLMSAVVDIRRFDRNGIGAFLLFCGCAPVKVEGEITIQRHRRGGGHAFNPEVKQAVWLLVTMQFMRRKDTTWGQRFGEIKEALKAKHPMPELVCETRIPLRDGKWSVDEATEVYTVELARGKVATYKGSIKESGGAKYLEVAPETIQLPVGWSTSNGVCAIPQLDGTTQYRLGKTRYTPIHLQKIASWKVATEFVIFVFEKWWEWMDEREASRKAT